MNTARQEALDRVATSTYYRLLTMPGPIEYTDGTRQRLLLTVGRFYQQIELLEGTVKIYSDFFQATSTRDRIVLDARYLDMVAPVQLRAWQHMVTDQLEWRRWWMAMSSPEFQDTPAVYTYLKLFEATEYVVLHGGVRYAVVVMTAKVAPKKGLNLWVARTALPDVYQPGGNRYHQHSVYGVSPWRRFWGSRVVMELMSIACAEAPELTSHLPDLSEIDN